jgi:hypothetical protein
VPCDPQLRCRTGVRPDPEAAVVLGAGGGLSGVVCSTRHVPAQPTDAEDGGGGGCDPMDSDVTPTAGAAAGELLWGGADGVNPPARWIVDGGDEDDELSAAAVLLSGFVRGGGGGGGGGRNSQQQVRMAPLQALKRGNNCRQRAWAAVW